MNKKISQFNLTNNIQDHDIITLVQDGENRNATYSTLTTELNKEFATKSELSEVGAASYDLINTTCGNLSNRMESEVDQLNASVKNVTDTTNEYYDTLNTRINTLDDKHNKDISRVDNTVQEWIDDIDNRSTLDQLGDATNRLTVAENTITALAETISKGEGSGSIPGYHTQSSATITPLTGYRKGTDASALNTSDSLNQALSKLENQIEAVADSSGALPVIKSTESTAASDGTLYTSLKVKKDYLSKHGDTADGRITFTKGIQAGETFRSGWDGQGASLYPYNSKWNLELDNLFVRGNMTVNELTINEIKAVGGDILVSLADMKCTEVQRLDDCYRCFFDNGNGTKYNQFYKNDMAICQKFDGNNVKRYWRKVNGTGENYIDLSLDVCEAGSAIPEVGDNILQLGHMIEADSEYNAQMDSRRNAIFISTKGENAPRIAFYKNIDEFTLADSEGVVRERVVIGGNQTKFVGTIYQTSDTGIVRIPVYKGVWVQGNTYNYYDQVTHKGSLWICMNPNSTTKEPVDNEDDWQKQVSKGETGKPSDDVAKWVEITGPRIFVYNDTTFTGDPTPSELSLLANVYGMTDPTYEWKLMDGSDTIISQSKYLALRPSNIPSDTKTLIIRCTVTNSDGSQYYDEVQIAKIANGLEGEDGYYIDLDNYNVTIPYYSTGTSKVDLSSAFTNVFAYKGAIPIDITNITATTTQGTATTTVTNNKVTLQSLNSSFAVIDLSITLVDGMTINKSWYINSTADGDDGFNGEDAKYVYLSGEQYFHYSFDSKGNQVCNPASITLSAEAFNILGSNYQWYWSVAGAYDWQKLVGETNKTLTVYPNGVYFSQDRKEVSFKCVASNDTEEYSDFITINKIYDGDTAYRATLQNESTSVVADHTGYVTDYTAATSNSKLKYGSNDITDYTLNFNVTVGSGKADFLLDNQAKSIKCTRMSGDIDIAVAAVSFIYNGDVVDTVDFVVTKTKKGQDGTKGGSNITIYRNTNSTPARPVYTTRPVYGDSWTLDPTYSTSYATWASNGTIDDNGSIVVRSDGYYWSTPYKISGRDGVDGTDGVDGAQGPQGAPGNPGPQGMQGPSLNFRGEYRSGNRYYWDNNTNTRDVVQKTSGTTILYYMVASKGQTSTSWVGSEWKSFNSFENIATGLLFAKDATIGGWIFNNGYMKSVNDSVGMSGNVGDFSAYPFLSVGDNTTTNPGFDTDTGKPSDKGHIRMYGTGTILVGDRNQGGLAGISGRRDTGSLLNGGYVRFWAGGERTKNDDGTFNTPFYVTSNGYLKAANAEITGNITCNSLSVANMDNWKAPGVVCIYHYNGTVLQELYSTGGKKITNIQKGSTGVLTIVHTNINTMNYICYAIGAKRYGDTGGFIGSSGLTSMSANTCTMLLKDTDNNPHTPDKAAAIDIIILSY